MAHFFINRIFFINYYHYSHKYINKYNLFELFLDINGLGFYNGR